MPNTPRAKKLGIKAGFRVLLLRAPKDFVESIEALPENVTVNTQPGGLYDLVLAFFHSRAEVEQHGLAALNAVKPGGLVWLCYPEQSSKLKSDVHRDTGWNVIQEAGWEVVSLIAIDNTWSAMRFRPSGEIKPRAQHAPQAGT